MIRIERTPVSQNPKCDSCLHYDGNAVSKGGACDIGMFPMTCGGGDNPRFGYAQLSAGALGPEIGPDLAVPIVVGTPGAMNEHGMMDQPVQMRQVVLGDELVPLAQRIAGDMVKLTKGLATAAEQGETSRFSPSGNVFYQHDETATPFDVAKSLYENFMTPRQQYKFSLKDTLLFLKEKGGFDVSDEDVSKAARYIGRFPQTRGPVRYSTKG